MVILKWKSDNANVLLIHSVIFRLYLGQNAKFSPGLWDPPASGPYISPLHHLFSSSFLSMCSYQNELTFLFFPLPKLIVNFGLYRCFLFILVTPPHTSPFIWLFHYSLFSLSLTGTFSKKPQFPNLNYVLCYAI